MNLRINALQYANCFIIRKFVDSIYEEKFFILSRKMKGFFV